MSPHLRKSMLCLGLVPALVAGCSSSKGSPETRGPLPSSPPTAASTTTTPAPSVVVRGAATLDGRPFDSRFVGAVVLRDGLVTPCQESLPPVRNGAFEVSVLPATASTGCGARDAKVALWSYANNRIMFSTNTVAWPAGQNATFNPTYSTASPHGVVPLTADFTGTAIAADGNEMPGGTRVEAYVGTTRCGVASIREGDDFTGYILNVVGPESIPGCTRGAPISFRVDGQPATGPAVTNTPPGRRDALDLKLAAG